LVAGRVTSAQEMEVPKIETTIRRIEALGAESGVPLACAPCGDFSDASLSPDDPLRCFFAVGVRLGAEGPCPVADLDAAMGAVKAIPQAVWARVMAGLDGCLSPDVALHLVTAGEKISGELRFGAAGDGRSVKVAAVSAPWSCWKIVDTSPATHQRRREQARALGVEHDWAQYWIVER
jgi:hypothetical protein